MQSTPQELFHLKLCGRRPFALVQDEEDWQALTGVARRMLFWCGGAIHGCRCQGREIRFAVQVGRAPIGAMARHVSGAYAVHLRRRRGWTGGVFNRYVAVPIDAELFIDDLVIWLHRPSECDSSQPVPVNSCWTADSAYITPNSLSWVTTEPVLAALSPSGAGRSAYRRRKIQPMDSGIVEILQRPRSVRMRNHERNASEAPYGLDVESIAKFIAVYSHISYEDMRSASRKRVLSKAKTLATVLSTRNGASVAAVARLFGRSRSTLIERAERYWETQPHIFANAERALRAYFDVEHSRRSHAPATCS
jgi:hypothetical protein